MTFNLRTYIATFFQRMGAFVIKASDLGIVVELGLFGGYEQAHEAI